MSARNKSGNADKTFSDVPELAAVMRAIEEIEQGKVPKFAVDLQVSLHHPFSDDLSPQSKPA
jgi:flavin-binding protein dodecin